MMCLFRAYLRKKIERERERKEENKKNKKRISIVTKVSTIILVERYMSMFVQFLFRLAISNSIKRSTKTHSFSLSLSLNVHLLFFFQIYFSRQNFTTSLKTNFCIFLFFCVIETKLLPRK